MYNVYTLLLQEYCFGLQYVCIYHTIAGVLLWAAVPEGNAAALVRDTVRGGHYRGERVPQVEGGRQ